MRRRPTICRWLFALAVLGGAPAAQAQAPSSTAASQAQSLFDGGRALLQAGKLAEACAAFESSEKLDPRASTMLNLASCREKSQQLAAAWAAYTEALRLARTSNNPKLAEVATNHLDKLERRVSRLMLTVPADHHVLGLEVLRNGEKLDAGSWNKPQLVDGGSYTITARAPGRTTWTVTRQIAVEGDRVQLEVPKLVDPTAVVAVAPPPPPAPNPHVPPPEPAAAVTAPPSAPAAVPVDAETRQPGYTTPIIIGVGALALAGAGVYFELHSHSTRDEAERLNQVNDPSAKSRNDDASHQRITGEVFDIAAVAAAGAAIYVAIHVHHEREAESIALTPVAGRALTGLALSGHW